MSKQTLKPYTGADLGATYSKSQTHFRVWAPTAEGVLLHLYRKGLGGPPIRSHFMKSDRNGTWVAALRGDLHGTYYTLQSMVDGVTREEAVDPYARAVGANGRRGMVVDLGRTDPAGWARDRGPSLKHPTDAIIYELHVRDFSIHPKSGNKFKGKFLAFTESGTRGPRGVKTGLDHLSELGITHVHLLPAFDFGSVDETRLHVPQYNWGYDPMNYNAPEGSYAMDPRDGAVRIREFKRMVRALHARGIGVIMDVVYNHTYRAQDSNFDLLVPGYYHRHEMDGTFSNGSGCGNETASEQPMFRKFMIDSLVYWATEYHIDGFRFDLMGLHDIETMNAIRAALDRVNRRILLYGEGWTGGNSPLPEQRRALKAHARKLNRIAAFSDDMRDGVKGPVWDAKQPGFVNGMKGREETIKFGVVASTRHPQVDGEKVWYSKKPWAAEPHHTVNYVSCHDNHTLWDKLCIANAANSEAERTAMDKLCAAIVLTSQGIAFLHAGEEMLRTKKGHENSYKLPDRINQIDWTRKARHRDVFEYYRGLIALRRAHPVFRMTSAAEIRRNLRFLPMPARNMVGFVLNGKRSSTVIFFNARRAPKNVLLPATGWDVLVDDRRASATPFARIEGRKIAVPALSAVVLTRRAGARNLFSA